MKLDEVLAHQFPQIAESYSRRDTILYALGVGFASEPLDPAHLRFLFEDRLLASPTMANTLGFVGLWMADPRYGISWKQMLHAEHRLSLHESLPPKANVAAATRILGIRDKGERGVMVHQETVLRDADDDRILATQIASLLARRDGGCGDWGDAPAELGTMPVGPPDQVLEMTVSEIQPLIYRLSGDLNPLHIDPAVAAAAGFERPILHGLATKGMAGYALLRMFCDFDPSRLRSMAVRFTRPVLPPGVIRFEFWGSAPGLVRFRGILCGLEEHVVLDRGEAQVA